MHTTFLAALVLGGMGLAFLLADPRAPTSRALGGGLIAGALSISITGLAQIYPQLVTELWWRIGAPALDSMAILLGYEWVWRLRQTIPDRSLDTRFGDRILRTAQAAVLIYFALALFFPDERLQYFIGGFSLNPAETSLWFYAFTIPLEISAALAGLAMLLLLRRKPDSAERKRLIAMCFAMPVMLSGFVLPNTSAAFVTVAGAMILLVGAIQYHIDQGRRSVFLSRFLSPDVANLVRSHGLEAVSRETRIISVLHCDIRGFTNRCKSLHSAEILDLLRHFYEAVGQCCERHGATIKDYAGDGIMILVGAPLTVEEPAEKSLQLARDLQRECAALLKDWSTDTAQLGLGIGIATGPVTLGVIGGLRLEYVAVGATVNFAARLCESAAPGEILLDSISESVQNPQKRELQLKGFGDQVAAYSAA